MEWFDTHCHLDVSPLAADVDAVLARARAAGVSGVLAVAYDRQSWDAIGALAGLPGVYCALGLHPWVADQQLDSGELRRRLQDVRAVAVGEIGLDFQRDGAPPRERQLEVLRLQLELACELGLPVSLHCRGAWRELLSLVRQHAPALSGALHAFSRGPELARELVAAGLHIAFGAAVTRASARHARQAVLEVPSDRLLIETDAPSIALEGVPADRVEPQHAAVVGATIAALCERSDEAVALTTTNNARRLFRIS